MTQVMNQQLALFLQKKKKASTKLRFIPLFSYKLETQKSALSLFLSREILVTHTFAQFCITTRYMVSCGWLEYVPI